MFRFRVRVALAVTLTAILTVLSWHLLLDDALIYYRYMRNALEGNGLVFNPGEHVNALTSPLFTYLLLLVSWMLHGHIHLAASLLFFVSFSGACLLAECLVPFSGVFLASMAYFYTLVGMETSVLVLLTMAVLWMIQTERWNMAPMILTLLFLTRAEAMAFVPAVGFEMYRRKRRPSFRAYLLPLLLVVAYVAANYALFHKALPQSSLAKLQQGWSGYWGKWPTAFLHVKYLVSPENGAYLTMPFLFLSGIAGLRQSRATWKSVLVIALGIMLCFYVLFNLPNYHWYYAPFLVGLVLFSTTLMNQEKRFQPIWLALIALQIGTATRYVSHPEARTVYYREAAEWIDAHAPSSATVEAAEIGQIGWTTHRRVVDMVGLTEPKNAKHIAQHDLAAWLREDKPDYIVMHTTPFLFEKAALEDRDYERAPFAVGNIYLLQRRGSADSLTK